MGHYSLFFLFELRQEEVVSFSWLALKYIGMSLTDSGIASGLLFNTKDEESIMCFGYRTVDSSSSSSTYNSFSISTSSLLSRVIKFVSTS